MEQLALKDLLRPNSYILTFGEKLKGYEAEIINSPSISQKNKIVEGSTSFKDDQLTLSFDLNLVGFNYEGVYLRTLIESIEYMLDSVEQNLGEKKQASEETNTDKVQTELKTPLNSTDQGASKISNQSP